MTIEAQLLERISVLLGKRTLSQAEFVTWLSGSPTGGPNLDGRYPFTDPDGNVVLVACPAKINVQDQLDAVALAVAGDQWVAFETIAVRDAYPTAPLADGRLGYVFRNNGRSDDSRNGFYQWRVSTGQWEYATWFPAAVGSVVQPLVEQAQAAATAARAAISSEDAELAGWEVKDLDGTVYVRANASRFETQVLIASQDRILHPNIQRLEAADGQPVDSPEAGVEFRDLEEVIYLKGTPSVGVVGPMKMDGTTILHPHIQRLDAAVAAGGTAVWSSIAAVAEVAHLMIYGQSLSRGRRADPLLSTAAQPWGKRFNGGVRAADGGTDAAAIRASLQPLVETRIQIGAYYDAETPAFGAAQMIAQLYAADNGVSIDSAGQALLMSAPGEGATSVAGLSSGTTPFGRLKDDITYGKVRADGLGKSYAPTALAWVQGNADYSASTSAATYKALFRKLVSDANDHTSTVMGAARTVPALMTQCASHRFYGRDPVIAQAQLDLCTDTGIAFATATHFLPYVAGDEHLSNVGSKWLGAYFGHAIYRWLWKGEKPSALAPLAVSRLGARMLALKFDLPSNRKLVIDNTIVPAQPSAGFGVANAISGASVPISSVRLTGRDVVTITTTADIPATASVRYAWTGNAVNGLGNLRDNSGETLVFDPAGINKPMHRWVPIFEKAIF